MRQEFGAGLLLCALLLPGLTYAQQDGTTCDLVEPKLFQIISAGQDAAVVVIQQLRVTDFQGNLEPQGQAWIRDEGSFIAVDSWADCEDLDGDGIAGLTALHVEFQPVGSDETPTSEGIFVFMGSNDVVVEVDGPGDYLVGVLWNGERIEDGVLRVFAPKRRLR
jgi:hypothetical protein